MNKTQSKFDLRHLVGVVATVTLLASTAVAQEQAESALPESDKPEAVAPEERFPVPDGTAEELLSFIEKVQQTPLPEGQRTRATSISFFTAQIAAVLAACDRIDTLKPEDEKTQVRVFEERFGAYQNLMQVDPSARRKLNELVTQFQNDKRPEIARLISGYNLESSTPGFFRLAQPQQEQLIRDLLVYMDRFGLDNTSYAVASGLGEALEMSESPEMGAIIFERLAQELKQTGDPRFTPQVARFEGTARRLNLPGKFMAVQGTTVEGEEFDWKSYRGQVVLVDFWASWCGPCRAEIPNMKAQLEKYGDKGFAIVGISLDQTKAAYQDFVDSQEITWVSLMSPDERQRGWDHPLAVHYGVGGIPLAILVDKQGKVVSLNATGRELNDLLDRLLGDGQPPADAAE